MKTLGVHTWVMFGRHIRNIIRQPIWIVLTLVQPFFWLVLYSQLFRRIVDLHGFGTHSYIEFLTPGVVVMTAFMAAMYSGLGMIQDLDEGVVERFLTTRTRRASLVLSRVMVSAIMAIVQTVFLLSVAYVLGVRIRSGVSGWIVVATVAALVASGFSGVSHVIALLARRGTTMIAVANFVGLPLVFFSTTLIAQHLMPGWMRAGAELNPIHWAVQAAREAMGSTVDWLSVAAVVGLLAGFAAATTTCAMLSLKAYLRTL